MPRFNFWHEPTESIQWPLPEAPSIGQEIVIGKDVYRVLGGHSGVPDPELAGEYTVEHVRQATREDTMAAARAMNAFRMSDGS